MRSLAFDGGLLTPRGQERSELMASSDVEVQEKDDHVRAASNAQGRSLSLRAVALISSLVSCVLGMIAGAFAMHVGSHQANMAHHTMPHGTLQEKFQLPPDCKAVLQQQNKMQVCASIRRQEEAEESSHYQIDYDESYIDGGRNIVETPSYAAMREFHDPAWLQLLHNSYDNELDQAPEYDPEDEENDFYTLLRCKGELYDDDHLVSRAMERSLLKVGVTKVLDVTLRVPKNLESGGRGRSFKYGKEYKDGIRKFLVEQLGGHGERMTDHYDAHVFLDGVGLEFISSVSGTEKCRFYVSEPRTMRITGDACYDAKMSLERMKEHQKEQGNHDFQATDMKC